VCVCGVCVVCVCVVCVCVWCVCVVLCVCVCAYATWHSKLSLKQKGQQRYAELSLSVVDFTKEKASSRFCLNGQHFPLLRVFTLPSRFIPTTGFRTLFCRLLGPHVSVTFIASRLEKATKMCVIELKWQSPTLRFSTRWTFIQFKFRHFDRMLKPQSKPER